MKKIKSNESLGIVINSSDEFLKFCNEIRSKYSSEDRFSSLKFLELIDSSYDYPILVILDLNQNYIPVDYRIEHLCTLSEREMDYCLPSITIELVIFLDFINSNPSTYELTDNILLDSSDLFDLVNKSYKEDLSVPAPLGNSLLPNKSIEFNKEKVMWDLIEKRDVLPVFLHFKNMNYVNINHIVNIDSDNIVYLSSGVIIKASSEEILNFHKLYSLGSSSLPCDCVSASKFGMIIDLSR